MAFARLRVLTPSLERGSLLEVGHDVFATLRRHRVTTHATAIAFRVLISFVPVALLGIALLGVLGLEDVWTDSLSPALHHDLAPSVATAADETVRGIFERNGIGLLVLAFVMVLWNTIRATSEVEHALEEIHEREGKPRSYSQSFLRRVALAVFVDVCVLSALLVFVLAPRIVRDGGVHYALEGARWVVAVVLLWLAVTALFRYAPTERPQASWASGGSALVVGGWLVASLAFGVWSTSIASYKTAVGTLTAFLVLTAYTLVVAYVFVLGAQLDETLRRRESSR